jgi:hypothetical protein
MSFRNELESLAAIGGDVNATVDELNVFLDLREELITESQLGPDHYKNVLGQRVDLLPSREAYLLGGFMMSALYVAMQNRDLVETALYANVDREVSEQFSEEFMEFCVKNTELIRSRDHAAFYAAMREYIEEKELKGDGLVLLGISLSNFFNGFPIQGRRGKRA